MEKISDDIGKYGRCVTRSERDDYGSSAIRRRRAQEKINQKYRIYA